MEQRDVCKAPCTQEALHGRWLFSLEEAQTHIRHKMTKREDKTDGKRPTEKISLVLPTGTWKSLRLLSCGLPKDF